MSEQELPRTGHEAVERMVLIFTRNGYKISQADNVMLFTCDSSAEAFQLSLLYNGDHGFELTHPDFPSSSWNCSKCFSGDLEYPAGKFFEHMETLVKQANPVNIAR